jgi:hypothetical protein
MLNEIVRMIKMTANINTTSNVKSLTMSYRFSGSSILIDNVETVGIILFQIKIK